MTKCDDGGAAIREIRSRAAAAYGWDQLDKPLIRSASLRRLRRDLRQRRQLGLRATMKARMSLPRVPCRSTLKTSKPWRANAANSCGCLKHST